MSTILTGARARQRLFIPLAASLVAAMSVAAGPPAPDPAVDHPALPPNAIVILVASWCAPCRGELARLDAITAAARGRTPRVLAIDDSAATRRMLRAVNRDRIWNPGAAAGAVRASLLARTSGLPFSVLTDARGAICAEGSGGLDAARTAALVARCGRP